MGYYFDFVVFVIGRLFYLVHFLPYMARYLLLWSLLWSRMPRPIGPLFGDVPKLKKMKFLFQQRTTWGWKCQNASPTVFMLIPAIFYEGIGYNDGMQAITFVGNRQSFKNFVAHWNFNTGVSGKVLKCWISWKRLIKERNGWKCGTCDTVLRTIKVWGYCSFLILWVHFVILGSFGALCKISF